MKVYWLYIIVAIFWPCTLLLQISSLELCHLQDKKKTNDIPSRRKVPVTVISYTFVGQWQSIKRALHVCSYIYVMHMYLQRIVKKYAKFVLPILKKKIKVKKNVIKKWRSRKNKITPSLIRNSVFKRLMTWQRLGLGVLTSFGYVHSLAFVPRRIRDLYISCVNKPLIPATFAMTRCKMIICTFQINIWTQILIYM